MIDIKNYHPWISSGQLLEGLGRVMRALELVLLLLFLGVRDPSCLCLTLLHLTEVHANGTAAKGISLRGPSVLLVGRPKPSDERIQTPPCLSERTGAWRRRIGLPEEDATVEMDLRFSKLVEVAKELQHVVEVAQGK